MKKGVPVHPGLQEEYTMHIHTRLLMVLKLRRDVEKYFVNVGMPEFQEKVSPATAFLPVVSCVSPTSAFLHQGQSGTAGHRLVRHCPAICYVNGKNNIFL
jgi:hypothetical protein